ncbi:MAG: protein kinase [Melioribacteraceae bacterium]|nr:protein kinase [Melioribacteraceae bacterium]MCF8413375.1 protein kinase [Melioribacteraceae bacterium]MCF8432508.1 protein kinase [Melioribacteraceae bacterium]
MQTEDLSGHSYKYRPPFRGEKIMTDGVTYQIGSKIGQGSYASVYECTDDWGNYLVAKVLVPQNISYEKLKKDWEIETRTLINLRNPFITQIYAAFEYKSTFYIITDRFKCTLGDLLEKNEIDLQKLIIKISKTILQAIDYLHKSEVIHNDIHIDNILTSYSEVNPKDRLPESITFKLSDFGISRFQKDENFIKVYSNKRIVPPEIIDPREFGHPDQSIDIYFSALVFLQILYGKLFFFTNEDIINNIPKKLALKLPAPYNYALAKALTRHVRFRTRTALDFWHDLNLTEQYSSVEF